MIEGVKMTTVNPDRIVLTNTNIFKGGNIRIFENFGGWCLSPTRAIEWTQSNEPDKKGKWVGEIHERGKQTSYREFDSFDKVIERVKVWCQHNKVDFNEVV